MKKKLHRYLAMLLVVLAAVGIYACGEKNTFQVSKIEKEYTNVKMASIGGMGDVVLNEERTVEFWQLFEGVVYEQTQTAGSLTDKSYSFVLLNGDVPVDSIQISEDGTTVTYGGYFYRLKEEVFDAEKMKLLFEEQRAELENGPEEESRQEALEEVQKPENETEQETEGRPAREEPVRTEDSVTEVGDADFASQKIIPVLAGKTCRVDLDMDGSPEEIVYEVQSPDGTARELLLYIQESGEDGEGEIIGSAWKEEWALLEYPSMENYFVVDLDSTDSFREIAVWDEGTGGGSSIHLIRYDGEEIRYLGSMTTNSSYDGLTVKGDGKIIGSGRLSLLQAWTAPFAWSEQDGMVRLLEEEWYYPYVSSDTAVKIKQLKKITVYAEADLESGRTELEPSEDVVTFGMTDNKNWVQFFRGDGISGWIYLEDGFYLETDGEKVSVMDVFENLSMEG